MNHADHPRVKKEAPPRYETCRRCGERWNISIRALIPPGGYLCPRCRNRPDERRPNP